MLQPVLVHFGPEWLVTSLDTHYCPVMEKMRTANSARTAANFRLYLQNVLVERCSKNPSYSLRAFAKSLRIGSSALSDILNKKRPITEKMKLRLGLALDLSTEQIDQFQSDRPKTKVSGDVVDPNYRQITFDTFAIISDWYHYAILELMLVANFRTDATWIAKALGISKSEANIAIERLIRVGLVEVDENGKWIDCSGGISTNIIDSSLTSAGSKKLQRQILELSIKALEELPISVRNHTSSTVAIDPKYLPEAIKKITKFRRELSEYVAKTGAPKEVYQLGISFFPVTNLTGETK